MPSFFARKSAAARPMGLSWGFFYCLGKMQRTKTAIARVILALVCAATCCANAVARAQANPESRTRPVLDEVGRHVAVPIDVHRIVTLAPNLAEIVYALGAEDRLVGVSEYTDHPPAAKSKPSIGMPVNPSLEAVVGAKPDLVLATTSINFAKTVDALSRLGIAVYTTDPHTVEGTLRSITDIGDVIGAAPQAQSLVANLRARLDALHTRLANTPPTPALFVVWENPLISIGNNTFIADALRWAGVRSVIDTKDNWPQISMEEVVKLDPDYIIYADNQMGENGAKDSAAPSDLRAAIAHHLDELRNQPAWRQLTATREGHVAVVDEEIEVPAPGLIDTIELLARELHPALFAHETGMQSNSSSEAALCAR
jgi:iron complex transport system substrate-binding protein